MTTKGGVSQPYLFKLVFKWKKKLINKPLIREGIHLL